MVGENPRVVRGTGGVKVDSSDEWIKLDPDPVQASKRHFGKRIISRSFENELLVGKIGRINSRDRVKKRVVAG